MKIKLYGLPTCSRCKSAKMMLEQRKKKGIIESYEYQNVGLDFEKELPTLEVDDKIFEGKEALLEIRKIK